MAKSYDSNRPRTQAKSSWIAVSRDLASHPIVGEEVQPPRPADPKRAAWFPIMVWEWMLREAAFDNRTCRFLGKDFALDRGQLAAAQNFLATKANWTRSAVRIFLAKLEREGMIQISVPIEVQKGQLGLNLHSQGHSQGHSQPTTILTICNYDKFQARPKMNSQGHSQGRARVNTSDNRQEDSLVGPLEQQSPVAEQNRSIASRTDGAHGDRLPFTEQSLAACEQMGFTRETIVARYYERTARRRSPVRDPSAYLIAIAVDLASKARGVPADAVRQSISKSTEERQAGQAQVTGAAREPSHDCLERVRRRCETRGLMVTALVAAWQQRTKGATVLKPDANLEAFAQWWFDKQRGAA